METDNSAGTTSFESTPRRVRRVIVPGSKPTMKIGSQIFHFPKGVNPDDVVGSDSAYKPAQVAPLSPIYRENEASPAFLQDIE